MVLHADEDVDDKLIRDIVETLLEVTNTAFRVLFEDLKFWVLLVKLVGDCAADDISQHRF